MSAKVTLPSAGRSEASEVRVRAKDTRAKDTRAHKGRHSRVRITTEGSETAGYITNNNTDMHKQVYRNINRT
jgi:hypothetical protein